MYTTETQLPIDESRVNESTRAAKEDATLSPRFYTTDFAAMDKLDVEPVRAMWDELVAEFRRDPNKDHFGRMGIDATAPFSRRAEFERKRIPGADTVDLAAYFPKGEST